MKRIITTLLICSLFVSCAMADEEKHLLWGIPFGSISEIQASLEENKGIKTKRENVKETKFTRAYSTLMSVNDDLTLFGIPFELKYNGFSDEFCLSLACKGTFKESREQFVFILTELLKLYGKPTEASIELYSDGYLNWKKVESTHEIIILEPDLIYAEPSKTCDKIENWEYLKKETECTVIVRFYNVTIEYTFDDSNSYHNALNIYYSNGWWHSAKRENLFEQYKVNEYQDVGL